MSLILGKTIFEIFSKTRQLKNHVSHFRKHSMFKRQDKIKEISPYIIVRASKEEFNEILQVMHDSFYAEEPTCSALNITPNPVLDERAYRAMAEGFTLVAKCKYNGCIVGACINESIHPWDPDMEEKLACSVDCNNVKKLIMFYAYMMRAPDLWRCLGIKKVFEMGYLFVKKSHRKKGLAYRLVQESKTLGADAGFPIIRCDATSHHTAKICERVGMQKVAEIPYCSYLDQNLQPIFKPPWPHEGVKVYCDCAPQYNELNKKLREKSKFFMFGKKRASEKPKEQHV